MIDSVINAVKYGILKHTNAVQCVEEQGHVVFLVLDADIERLTISHQNVKLSSLNP